MKRKNGFTLVEILMTISLLSLIMIIVVPSVITINKKVKNKLYNTKVSQAEEATLLWVQDNPNCLSSNDDSCMINKNNCTSYDENKIQCTITMGKLAANNLIKYDDEEKEDIYSPIDNASMNDVEISFIYNLKTKLISINPSNGKTPDQPSNPDQPFNPSGSSDDVNYCLNFYNDKSGTLLAGIKKKYKEATDPITTPGKEISAEDEAVLASTPDDYGNSLYFRGNVQNNYVEFAGKCWRIVRVTGDCSIKLILANENFNNDSKPCQNSYSEMNPYMVIREDETKINGRYQTWFNQPNDNTYVGFKYAYRGATTYEETQKNTNDSYVLLRLNEWYDKYFKGKNYEKMLADTIWCNDKSTVHDTKYNPFKIGKIGTKYGVSNNVNYYSTAKRLVSSSGKAGGDGPTLKCPDDDIGGKLSKFTAEDKINGNGDLQYKIGILSADEVAFAGGAYNIANKNTYLTEKDHDYYGWWLLSPWYYRKSVDNYNAHVTKCYTGAINGSPTMSRSEAGVQLYGLALRPAISLVSDITISSGTGSSSDPFVITGD